MSSAPEKLSIIVFSGEFDRVHYALVTAASALALGRKVTLFFTMWATRALLAGDGWRAMPVSDRTLDAGALEAQFASRGTATFAELLEACVALKADFMVCEMGMKAMGLTLDQLRPDVPLKEGGMVTFLSDANKDGAILFV
jgi:peroxiredoxin family protein